MIDLILESVHALPARRDALLAAHHPLAAAAQPMNAAGAVTAPAAAAAGRRAADEGGREGAKDDGRGVTAAAPQDRSDGRRDGRRDGPAIQTRTGAYDRQMVYENAYGRLFLDVVDRDRDERILRIPSEKLIDYLQTLRRNGAAAADPAVDTRV